MNAPAIPRTVAADTARDRPLTQPDVFTRTFWVVEEIGEILGDLAAGNATVRATWKGRDAPPLIQAGRDMKVKARQLAQLAEILERSFEGEKR